MLIIYSLSVFRFPKYVFLKCLSKILKRLYSANFENTIYHDDDNPSYIVLPIVSAKPAVLKGILKSRYLDLPYYKGSGELHIHKKAIYLHFDDTWIKYEIKSVKLYPSWEVYICYGDCGRIVVVLNRSGNVWRVMVGGYRINFWGSA